jgi:hypothetical protein
MEAGQKPERKDYSIKQTNYNKNNLILGYICMFPQYIVFTMEIFVLILGQEDSLLDEAIFASPHDASSLAHVTLKFSLSVTNHRNENSDIFSSYLNKLGLCAHVHS